jgi:hypothetical protein
VPLSLAAAQENLPHTRKATATATSTLGMYDSPVPLSANATAPLLGQLPANIMYITPPRWQLVTSRRLRQDDPIYIPQSAVASPTTAARLTGALLRSATEENLPGLQVTVAQLTLRHLETSFLGPRRQEIEDEARSRQRRQAGPSHRLPTGVLWTDKLVLEEMVRRKEELAKKAAEVELKKKARQEARAAKGEKKTGKEAKKIQHEEDKEVDPVEPAGDLKKRKRKPRAQSPVEEEEPSRSARYDPSDLRPPYKQNASRRACPTVEPTTTAPPTL